MVIALARMQTIPSTEIVLPTTRLPFQPWSRLVDGTNIFNESFEICPPQIQSLFSILENGKSPLTMVKDVVPLIKWLRENDDFKKYADGIDELLVVRLLEQLSKVSNCLIPRSSRASCLNFLCKSHHTHGYIVCR